MPPASVESRTTSGQPAAHSTPSPPATEHASTGTPDSAVPRHRVVPRDGALDERLAVAGDVDVPPRLVRSRGSPGRGEALRRRLASDRRRQSEPSRKSPTHTRSRAVVTTARVRPTRRTTRSPRSSRGRSGRSAPPVATAAGPSSRVARASHRDGRDGGRQADADQHRGPPRRRSAPVRTSPSACRTSSTSPPQVGWRSSGSLAIARASTSSTAGGSDGRRSVARGGGCLEMRVDDARRRRPPRTAASRSATRRAGSRARRRRRGRRRASPTDLLRRDVVDRAHQAVRRSAACPRRSA